MPRRNVLKRARIRRRLAAESRRFRPLMIAFVAAPILAVAVACGTSPTEKAPDLARELVYFKDHRTGICFAFWKHPNSDSMDTAVLAAVPCDAKVEALLVNGPERGVR